MIAPNILIEAIGYIRKFRKKIFVVKLGGKVMLDEESMNSVTQDLALLNSIDIRPVVVHGGGPEITRTMEKFNKKPEFINGLRVTDKETMEIAMMVLIGKINTQIITSLSRYGVDAIGLSGKSSKLIEAKIKDEKLGMVGEIEKINTKILDLMIDNNYIPVIAPVGIDHEGNSLNINADTVASKIASALKAEKLIIMTDVDGILDADEELIPEISIKNFQKIIDEGIIKGGMLPKVEACMNAIQSGVKKAHIIKGEGHNLLEEIFTEEGVGTVITE